MPLDSKFNILAIDAFCLVIWKIHNKAHFEKKMPLAPIEPICYMCAFMRLWAGFQSEGGEKVILEGANMIQRAALRTHEATCKSI